MHFPSGSSLSFQLRKGWILFTSALGLTAPLRMEHAAKGAGSSILMGQGHPRHPLARSIRSSEAPTQYEGIESVLAGLPKGPAAEIGCGKGHSLCVLAKLGFAPLYGLDHLAECIESSRILLRENGIQCDLHQKEASALDDVSGDSLALIYCRNVFQYLEHVRVARSFYRALRPGGYLVMEAMGLSFYLWSTHLRNLFNPERFWTLFSYPRVILRTLLYQCCGKQFLLGGTAPEMGCTLNVIERFANLVKLQIVSVGPAPSLPGYLCILRKPIDG